MFYSNNGSLGNYNIRKGFLNPNSMTVSQFDTANDEPTYLTFKLNFYSDEEETDKMLYDTLPQGLFTMSGAGVDSIFAADSDAAIREAIASFNYEKTAFKTDKAYSAVRYLLDRNEDFRAYQLVKFIKGWNELQEQYQYYFQKVNGLDDFFKSAPDKGMNLPKDATITIECLEGIDQKIKYLLSLYRSAAWDNEYQKWILPDIFRYFKMDILISEIRTFHQSNYSKSVNNASILDVITNASTLVLSQLPNSWANSLSGITNIGGNLGTALNSATTSIKNLGNITSFDDLKNLGTSVVDNFVNNLTGGGVKDNTTIDSQVLSILNGIAPVTCIHCEMCDFDNNTNLYAGSYSISNQEQETTSIKIKVKKAEIIYNWTLMDRIFGNLISNYERGKASMTVAQGKLDYLGKQNSGPFSQEFFNNSIRMAESDKSRSYTKSITTGWMAEAATDVKDALSDFVNTGSVLNLANDLINTTREAIAGIRESQLFNSGIKTSLEGGSIIMPKTSLATSTEHQLLTSALDYIAEEGKKNVENDSVAANALNLIQNFGQYYQDLSQETQDMLKSALESVTLTSMVDFKEEQSFRDRSLATELDGGRPIGEIIIDGSLIQPYSMVGVDSSIDRSMATELDGGPGEGLTPLTPTEILLQLAGVSPDSSELNLQLAEISPDSSELNLQLAGVSPDSSELNLQLTQVSPYPNALNLDLAGVGPDSSELNLELNAPDLQTELDRSWATDLDGGPFGDLTGTLDSSLDLNLNAPDLQTELDRSWATDLDGQDQYDLTGLTTLVDTSVEFQMIDTSTDDGGEDDEEYPSEIIGGTLQTEDDRSWATDLDGQDQYDLNGLTPIIGVDDRSWATDLDGGPEGELMPVTPNDLDLNLVAPNIQKELDRSWATDLDGGPNGQLTSTLQNDIDLKLQAPNIQKELDRSWATDLDGGPNGQLTSTLQNDIDLSLSSPKLVGNEVIFNDKLTPTDISTTEDIEGTLVSPIDNSEEFITSLTPQSDLTYQAVDNTLVSPNLESVEWNNNLTPQSDLTYQPYNNTIISPLIKDTEWNNNLTPQGLTEIVMDNNGRMIPVSLNGNLPDKMTNVKVDSEKDRSWATDLDGSPTMNTKELSLFERIAQSQATNRNSVLSETKLVSSPESKAESKVILPTGEINPKAKVEEIIQEFANLQEQKMRTKIEDVKLTTGEPTKKVQDVKVVSAIEMENKDKNNKNVKEIKGANPTGYYNKFMVDKISNVQIQNDSKFSAAPQTELRGIDPNKATPQTELRGLEPSKATPQTELRGVEPNKATPQTELRGLEPNNSKPQVELKGSEPIKNKPQVELKGSNPQLNKPQVRPKDNKTNKKKMIL